LYGSEGSKLLDGEGLSPNKRRQYVTETEIIKMKLVAALKEANTARALMMPVSPEITEEINQLTSEMQAIYARIAGGAGPTASAGPAVTTGIIDLKLPPGMSEAEWAKYAVGEVVEMFDKVTGRVIASYRKLPNGGMELVK
jgi:hypothetical protein